MNVGIKPKTIEKFNKVKGLVAEGVGLMNALKRCEMPIRTWYRLKAIYEPK